MENREKKGVGEHGRRGETKALILIEILKESLNDLRKGPLGPLGEILKVVRTGFAPVSRSDLKDGLKGYKVSKKNADAIIRNLENDKAIKIKPTAVVLNNLTIEGIVSIMEILSNGPYYMVPSTKNEIKKASPDKRPFLGAINKAFAECFLCAYGDVPFDSDTDPKGWKEKTIRLSMAGKRPDLTPDQVNEILEIASKLRGDLTIRFKLMYIWMASVMIENGRDSQAEKKQKYSSLSLAEKSRRYIEDPDNIAGEGKTPFTTFLMGRLARFMLMADDPSVNFLEPAVNPNEKDILELKVLLATEKTRPLEYLLRSHRYIEGQRLLSDLVHGVLSSP